MDKTRRGERGSEKEKEGIGGEKELASLDVNEVNQCRLPMDRLDVYRVTAVTEEERGSGGRRVGGRERRREGMGGEEGEEERKRERRTSYPSLWTSVSISTTNCPMWWWWPIFS